jgi:hypothetical protein
MTITAPAGYKEFLTNQFGVDYMTPVRIQGGHEYPFFRDEVRVLMGGDTGDCYIENGKEVSDSDIPDEWKTVLIDSLGNLKRIVLYGLSGTDILNNGTLGIAKIIDYLRNMNAQDGVIVICFAPSGLLGFIEKCELSLLTDYRALIESVAEMDNVILDFNPDSTLIKAVMGICDEYYGDDCRLMELCESWEIPVTKQVYQ